MTNAILRGKPDAGNPHVWFDEGEVASYPPTAGRHEGVATRGAKPRRGSLLYKKRLAARFVVFGMASCLVSFVNAEQLDPSLPDGSSAVFDRDEDYTISAGEASSTVNFTSALQFKSHLGKTVTFDGSGVDFHQPESTVIYPNPSFGFYRGTAQFLGVNADVERTKPISDMSDFKVSLTETSPDGAAVNFEKGTYNFYSPGGVTRSTDVLNPALKFFHNGTYGAAGTSPVVRFGPGVDINLPCWWYQGNNPTNTVVFDGARAVVAGGAYFPFVTGGASVGEEATVSRINLENGAKLTFKRALYMANASTLETDNDHVYEFNVRGGSRLDTLGAFGHIRTDTRIAVSGENSEFVVAGSLNAGQKAGSAFSVDVRDGGTFFLTNYVSAVANLVYLGSSNGAKISLTGNGGTYKIRPPLTFYQGTVDLTNCTWDVGAAQYRLGYAGYSPVDMRFNGGTFSVGGIHCLAWTGVASLTCDGCNVTQLSHMNVGGNYESSSSVLSGCTGTVNVVEGRFQMTNGGVMYLGAQGGARGILNVSGGTYTEPSSIGTCVGYYGSAEVNVSGGLCSSTVLRTGVMASPDADVPEDIVRVSGGELRTSTELEVAHDESRTGRLELTGGYVTAKNVYGGAGTSVLSANGGTVSASDATTSLIHDFTTAEIGAAGLTIDSNGKTITVPQAFVNKAGESGRLVLAGAGVKTLTGDLTGLDTVEVTAGSADLIGRTVKNLVLNGGTLVLDAAKPIVVTGTLTVECGSVAFVSQMTRGTVCDVLKLSRPLTEASLDNLRGLLVAAGLSAEDVCDFTQVSDGEGGYLIRTTVRESANLVISLAEGTSNATERLDFNVRDTLTVDVAKGAALTASGVWKRGALTKQGGGLLTLANAEDAFVPGYTLLGGGLTVVDTAVLGLERTGENGVATIKSGALNVLGNASGERLGPMIALTANATGDVVVLNTAVDVTMPCPVSQNGNGELVKRGAGRLTFEVEGMVRLGGGEGAGDNAGGFWSQAQARDAQPFEFDEPTGTLCGGEAQPLDVYEGELRIVGKGSGATASVAGTTVVGRPGTSGTAQPGLVLDNVTYNFSVWNRHFLVGPFINYSTKQTVDMAMTPYLTLTNNATLKGGTLQICRLNNLRTCAVTTIVDGSRMELSSIYPHRGQCQSSSRLFFRNESTLKSGDIYLFRPFEMFFVNSTCDVTRIRPEAGVNITSMTGTFDFKNGSTFRCGSIAFAEKDTIDSPMTFTFDDSAWVPSEDDYVFGWAHPEFLKIVTTGGGLKLPVPADRTWTVNQPIEGTGDVANAGAGTLVLGENAVAYTGVTKAAAGATIDLGGRSHPIVLGGAGTFRNGTVANGGIALAVNDRYETAEVPSLDGVTFAGSCKVSLGRTAETPLVEPFGSFAVCTYTGVAPDVSGWKLKDTGTKGVGGRFVAAGGVVTCTPEHVGFVMIFR